MNRLGQYVATTRMNPLSRQSANEVASAAQNENLRKFDFLLREKGDWREGNSSIQELCIETKTTPEIFVVFLSTEAVLAQSSMLESILTSYKIPPCFWTSITQEASGFFGAQNTTTTNGELESYGSYFRFLVKDATHSVNTRGKVNVTYAWHKLGFFTTWLPSKTVVAVCFDLPCAVKNSVCSSLLDSKTSMRLEDPFAIHAILVEQIAALYDATLWSCRNIVRYLEKHRTSPEDPHPDYDTMHEIARHIIHSSEMLEMAVETMTSMIQEHELFCEENPSLLRTTVTPFRQAKKTLRFQSTIFKCLQLRSKALEERLRNEINLAFNIVAQHDSRIAVRIGEATQVDSAAMKTISILGLVFLPGTFMSAIFSMSFFNFTPGTTTEPERWTLSEKFWIYWVVAGPLTVIAVGCWLAWQRIYTSKAKADSGREPLCSNGLIPER